MTITGPSRLPDVETGRLAGEWPFVRIGNAPRTLVVFPGVHDAIQDVTANPRFAAWFCRRLAGERTVYMISRRDNLPTTWRAGEMAADYALVIARFFERPDVLGVSLGSAIAQEFALAFPNMVGRLVLATAGCRMPPDKRHVCDRWRELSQRAAWRELYMDLVDSIYGRTKRMVFQALLPHTDGAFVGLPAAQNDFLVSVETSLDFDTTYRVSAIRTPTLVIGGEDDCLMPADSLRDLAARIPGAELKLIAEAGHGVFEEQKEEFDQSIVAFLDR